MNFIAPFVFLGIFSINITLALSLLAFIRKKWHTYYLKRGNGCNFKGPSLLIFRVSGYVQMYYYFNPKLFSESKQFNRPCSGPFSFLKDKYFSATYP